MLIQLKNNKDQVHAARHRRDVFFRILFSLGGVGVLLTLLAVIWHLLSQVLPLMASPKLELSEQWPIETAFQPFWIGDLKAQGLLLHLSEQSCRLTFYQLQTSTQSIHSNSKRNHHCAKDTRVSTYMGWPAVMRFYDDGRAKLELHRLENNEVITKKLLGFSLPSSLRREKWKDWQFELLEKRLQIIFHFKDSSVLLSLPKQAPDNMRLTELAGQYQHMVTLPMTQQILVTSGNVAQLFDMSGQLVQNLKLPESPAKLWRLPSGRSILMTYPSGKSEQWSMQNETGVFKLSRRFEFDLSNPISWAGFSSEFSAGMLKADDRLHFYHLSTGELVSSQPLQKNILSAHWFNNRLYLTTPLVIQRWQSVNLTGMMTWSSLWHPIWYEGHEHPSYLWQSGQSDNLTIDKLSLYPMLVGSIKAALLAMFVAVPVAFLAAVYTAFFASEYLRGKLKAAIEILESIPTVIIGFIVSMILVKVQGTGLLFLVIYLVSLPVAVFLHGLLQTRLKGDLNRQGIKGNAVWSLLLTFLLLAVLVYWIADKIPLDGYLIEANRVNYSDKIHSAVIIAFALGIAVVPSVYSLAEEAIYSVPRDLKQAAYSLGATSLQTLKKVVLVMAFPGILSAIVLGFGRAIGETMIVLMLTSNTPVADWSFFSELRTLTANLAIELPRSYVGSVHASVLFTSALLLFAFTFLINSIAQWLKFRLRKKYHYV